MCFGGPPKPPPLPEPRPTPPKPEKTAERVVVSSNRKSVKDGQKKPTGQRKTIGKRLGTQSLRIPLTQTNLKY
tara:strand:+ start:235 stop:453 length:219 start_codon:yes stop_codon:yes gene_type:complete